MSSLQADCSSFEVAKKCEWNQDRKNALSIADTVHVQITVFEPLTRIIDTREFQRLRQIKQLGFTYLVYPTANHDRFTHSLGVYHLALRHVNALAKKEPCITTIDKLCVCTAALIHDLGHGPFSHLYEEFLKKTNPFSGFRHESYSIKVFHHLLEHNLDVKRTLDDYLEENDYKFIEELVDPPKDFLDKNGNWLLQGRGKEKSFLYDIVSNRHDSIDVDKFDYLLRDSKLTTLTINFGKNNLKRIRNNMEPRAHKINGYKRIAYSKKLFLDLKNVLNSRDDMHNQGYQHKTKISFELMAVEALVKAKDWKIKGKDGVKIALCEAHTDIEAFLNLDDVILDRICYSNKEELKDAREIIKEIKCHKQLPFIGKTILTEIKDLNLTQEELEENVKRDILRYDTSIEKEDFIVAVRKIHRGMGSEVDPLSQVLLFNEKDYTDKEVHRAFDYSKKSVSNEKISIAIVYVFLSRKNQENDKVHQAFIKCAQYYNSEVPPKRRKKLTRSCLQIYKDHKKIRH